MKERTWVGFLAGAAPDLDFVVSFLGPVAYLEHHRGATHSLLLLPLWALLLAWAFSLLRGRVFSWKAYYGVVALGLGIHILGDLITSYGTQILAPISTWAPGLNTTFIIDPWLSGLLFAGFVLSLYWRPRAAAAATLAVMVAVVAFQYSQYRSALDVGEAYAAERNISPDKVEAYPQALSWFNWKVVVTAGETYHHTRINLLLDAPRPDPGADAPWLLRLWSVYQPPEQASWKRVRKFGAGGADPLARAVWGQEEFAFYRRFADLPLVYNVETVEDERCVWFHDLRFEVVGMTPPFRYGMCRPRTSNDGWSLYRIESGERQKL